MCYKNGVDGNPCILAPWYAGAAAALTRPLTTLPHMHYLWCRILHCAATVARPNATARPLPFFITPFDCRASFTVDALAPVALGGPDPLNCSSAAPPFNAGALSRPVRDDLFCHMPNFQAAWGEHLKALHLLGRAAARRFAGCTGRLSGLPASGNLCVPPANEYPAIAAVSMLMGALFIHLPTPPQATTS